MSEMEYNETELSQVIRAMRQREMIMTREGMFWTDEERNLLRECFEQGGDTRALAVRLHRSEEAIWKQMEKLYKQVRKRQKSKAACLCTKCRVQCENSRKT